MPFLGEKQGYLCIKKQRKERNKPPKNNNK